MPIGSSSAAEDFTVDPFDRFVSIHDRNRQRNLARYGWEADLVIAALIVQLDAQLVDADFLISRNSDVKAHNRAPFINGQLLFRKTEMTNRGGRKINRTDFDSIWRFYFERGRDGIFAERAIGVDVETFRYFHHDRRLHDVPPLGFIRREKTVYADVRLDRNGRNGSEV